MDLRAARTFDQLLLVALREDRADGDLTTLSTVTESARARAALAARADGVCAGLALALRAFELRDGGVRVDAGGALDGQAVSRGAAMAVVAGRTRALLSAERTALNLLGHLSGIATLTRRYVDAVAGTGARIADTRKTLPGLRALQRYAVRAGGGFNHRFSLGDAVLVKDNHIAAVGSLGAAVAAARAAAGGAIVEAECETPAQVEEALGAGADAVLLDNMDVETTRAAVALVRGRAVTEASGNITLERVRAVAETGVDVISVGALTRSAPSLDVALDFQI